MNRFGLTGGIACGKSTLARMLEELGWRVIDADAVVHGLYQPGAAGTKKIVDAFGPEVLNYDKSVDRAKLGELVFSDSEKLKLLNSIIHPLARSAWQQEHRDHMSRHPSSPALIVIPLLFEAGIQEWFDSVACVGCSPGAQTARLRARGLEGDEIAKRLAAQWPLARKMEMSQVVLWNNGALEHLQRQARALDAHWQERL